MTHNVTMTRDEMQAHALFIQDLIDAALLICPRATHRDVVTILQIAKRRAGELNHSLDVVNQAGGAA